MQSITLNQIELLDPVRHNRKSFTSGVAQLDAYLRTKARKDAPSLSLTFALTCKEEVGEILGYYSLSSAHLRSDDLPADLMKKIGHYGAIPATLLGRLAVAEAYQRTRELRVGEKLLVDATLRSYSASLSVASFGMIVDVLVGEKGDPTSFYEKYGFRKCANTAGKMYLPMKTIIQIMKAATLI